MLVTAVCKTYMTFLLLLFKKYKFASNGYTLPSPPSVSTDKLFFPQVGYGQCKNSL